LGGSPESRLELRTRHAPVSSGLVGCSVHRAAVVVDAQQILHGAQQSPLPLHDTRWWHNGRLRFRMGVLSKQKHRSSKYVTACAGSDGTLHKGASGIIVEGERR
jgi:hypothetical protein